MPEMRFLDSNYLMDSASTVTASTADSEFPVSNLTKYTRGRVWRSYGGNYVIDATNNKLDFKESGGGAELTATIASSTYTAATLCTAIKTQLDSVGGAPTYTVSFSATTGKFTITSNGAFLSLLWNTGTNTATSIATAIGFSTAADDTGAVTYTGDTVALHTEEWIKIDLGSARNVDSFVLMFDPIDGSTFTSPTLTLQGNATDSWASPSVSESVSIDSTYKIATHFFASNQSYRYWRLKMVDKTNTNLYLEVPKIILADSTQLTQMPEIGFISKTRDNSKIIKTPYGHTYADIYPTLKTLSVEYAHISEADIETLRAMYARMGNRIPFGVSLDSTATLFDKDRFFIYGTFSGEFSPKQTFATYFSVGLSIEEVV